MKKQNNIIFNSKELTFEFWNHFDPTICAVITTYVMMVMNNKVKGVIGKEADTKIPNHIITFKTKKEYLAQKEILILLFSEFLPGVEVSSEFNITIK